jgi:hypothetical protein
MENNDNYMINHHHIYIQNDGITTRFLKWITANLIQTNIVSPGKINKLEAQILEQRRQIEILQNRNIEAEQELQNPTPVIAHCVSIQIPVITQCTKVEPHNLHCIDEELPIASAPPMVQCIEYENYHEK